MNWGFFGFGVSLVCTFIIGLTLSIGTFLIVPIGAIHGWSIEFYSYILSSFKSVNLFNIQSMEKFIFDLVFWKSAALDEVVANLERVDPDFFSPILYNQLSISPLEATTRFGLMSFFYISVLNLADHVISSGFPDGSSAHGNIIYGAWQIFTMPFKFIIVLILLMNTVVFGLFGALIFLVSLMIYNYPSYNSYAHKKSNSIRMMNVLLGWTLLGWVLAFIWSRNREL